MAQMFPHLISNTEKTNPFLVFPLFHLHLLRMEPLDFTIPLGHFFSTELSSFQGTRESTGPPKQHQH